MQCKNMQQNTFWKLSWCTCLSSPEARTSLGTRWGTRCTDSQPPPDSTTTPLLTVTTLMRRCDAVILFCLLRRTSHKTKLWLNVCSLRLNRACFCFHIIHIMWGLGMFETLRLTFLTQTPPEKYGHTNFSAVCLWNVLLWTSLPRRTEPPW